MITNFFLLSDSLLIIKAGSDFNHKLFILFLFGAVEKYYHCGEY